MRPGISWPDRRVVSVSDELILPRLFQIHAAIAKLCLNPTPACVQVPNTTDAKPSSDSHCFCCICGHLQFERESKVSRYAVHANQLRCSFAHSA